VDVVYEDAFALVVEKPPHLAVHPTLNYPLDTLANGYAAWALRQGRSPVFRPVNRIDKDTSGLVLAAQNGYAAPLLAQRVEKLYYAVAEGELPLGPGVIDAPIGRQGESIIGRCVTPDGKPSRTEYTILKAENGLSLAACVPVTGRTHQIRVHFASIGHPLAGDDLYGGSRARIGRQALHCAKQTFWVPRCERMPDGIRIEVPVDETTLRPVTVESPLPEDMAALFD
jgi:23S rRNA pseudouridine1911/1915/1917 synthase